MADAAMADFYFHFVRSQLAWIKFKRLQWFLGGFCGVSMNWCHKSQGSAGSIGLRNSGFLANQVIEATADSITFEISGGLEIKLTWLAFISLVLAPIRFAMNLSKSGLMELSWIETTYQDGILFHAAALMGSPKMAAAKGFWVAASTDASFFGKSFAKTD